MKRHHFLWITLLGAASRLNITPWLPTPQAPLRDIQLWSCSLSTIISTTIYSGPYQLLLNNVSHLHWKRGKGSRPNFKISSNRKFLFFQKLSEIIAFICLVIFLIFYLAFSSLKTAFHLDFSAEIIFTKISVLSFGITGHTLFWRFSFPPHPDSQNTLSVLSIFVPS